MDISKPVPTIYGYFNEKFGNLWTKLVEDLKTEFPESLEEIQMPMDAKVDLPTLTVKKADAHAFLQALKNKYGFQFLSDYTAIDEEIAPRFRLVLHLMSLETKARIRIKIKLNENESMPTLIPLWEGANWAEREIFDMFGILFNGHPDLRRILMDMRWEGHPLRKDYPLRGYQIFLTPEPLDPELLK